MNIEILKNSKIVVYGAGKIGKNIYSSLRTLGFEIEFFWDQNHDKIDEIKNEKIMKPEMDSIPSGERNDYVVFVTIFAKNINQSITDDLLALEYIHVINKREDLNSIIYQACKFQRDNHTFNFDIQSCFMCPVIKDDSTCEIFEREIKNEMAFIEDENDKAADKVIIPKIGVLVSNKCNLKCKGCNHLRDHYKPGDLVEFTVDEILSDVQRIVDAADAILQVAIVGGEAFLHKNLDQIIDGILKMQKIGIVQIITNGTIIPKNPQLFRTMSNKRLVVEVSGYGDTIPEKLRGNVKRFLDELKNNNVNHFYADTLQWFDFGGFKKRSYSIEQHHQVYETCCFVSNDIFHGKLHKCSRSVFANYLNLIPDYKDDYIDLRNNNGEELRKELKRFLNMQSPKVCLHCNGASTDLISVGDQGDNECK